MTNLKQIIKSKYGSNAAFGLKIGWVPQKVSKMLAGEYIPKLTEANTIAAALDISIDDVANFFACKSPKG